MPDNNQQADEKAAAHQDPETVEKELEDAGFIAPPDGKSFIEAENILKFGS